MRKVAGILSVAIIFWVAGCNTEVKFKCDPNGRMIDYSCSGVDCDVDSYRPENVARSSCK